MPSTSASLFAERSDGSLFHALFDAGYGVGASLACEPLLAERPALDLIALSHWHGDHTGDLPTILTSWRRTRARRALRLPEPQIWCREGTALWLSRDYHYLWDNLDTLVALGDEPSGTPLPGIHIGETENLTILPFTVSHRSADIDASLTRRSRPCCASFLIHAGDAKAVLLWDIDPENSWLSEPTSAEEKRITSLLHGADILIIACNGYASCAGNPTASHTGILDISDYVRALAPRQTLLTHLSGHEDGALGFGWTDDRWAEEAAKLWEKQSLPGRVDVARPGSIHSL